MTLGRAEVSGGGVLVLAALYYLDSSGVMGWVLLGCALHELGHCAAIRLLGGRIARFRLTWAGAELRLSPRYPLSTVRTAVCVLAGPLSNLLIAWAAAALARRGAGEQLYLFSGVNLGLAGFNLLPAGRLDGGRALRLGLRRLMPEDAADRVGVLCSEAVAALLLGGGLVLLWQSEGANFTLLICGLWMAAAGRQELIGAER